MSDPGLTYDERVAVARLHALLELLPTALDKELGPAGITSFEFTLLEALHEADHHRLRLSALAARTNATLARLSRVVTSLERKDLVLRAPCEQDGRATNAVLTDAGERVYLESSALYADAVRRMVLDGLDDQGVDQLATLSFTILSKLDPDRRLSVTGAGAAACAADPLVPNPGDCAADPARAT
ncbi:MarR family winged helix-turn-helix transcriptional regulator [Microbacterium rhizomatis]|uniref:MarR family transcriptional regulator n=1 Tax=Microbacterium rhizomatis TaxID=1631477 RepID=A0A5J5IWC5_9MICO|nr:MarR family transcriptional regulator [Microbacterium rhizomatis]KAA9104983.1 MarR family transcriptional regulator [Microbacterium rhizomatis]